MSSIKADADYLICTCKLTNDNVPSFNRLARLESGKLK